MAEKNAVYETLTARLGAPGSKRFIKVLRSMVTPDEAAMLVELPKPTTAKELALHERMEALGIRPERLQLEWVSAAEGLRWQEVMRRMEELRQAVTPEEIAATVAVLTTPYKGKSPPAPKAAGQASEAAVAGTTTAT